MIALAAAILVTSLLGSMHCVGMCGPMALWASGVGGTETRRGETMVRLAAYHVGRWITFLAAGLAAGLVGGWVTTGGDWLGWQQTAARLAGSAMIGLGVWKALHWWRPVAAGAAPAMTIGRAKLGWGQRLSLAVSRRLAMLRPGIVRLPGHWRALAIGMVTTLLPCGWLYLFVLVAAATASVAPAMMVMTAFWVGTLPALTALVAGAVGAAPRFRPAMPILAAAVLVVTGMYTVSGRASTDLMPLGEAARRYASDGEVEVTGESMVVGAATGESATGESLPGGFGASVMRVLYGLRGEPLPCCEPTGPDVSEACDACDACAASDVSAGGAGRRLEAGER